MFIQSAEPASLRQDNVFDGVATTISENFSASFDNQLKNESQFGLEAEFDKLYQKQADIVYQATGQKLEHPHSLREFFDYAAQLENKDMFLLQPVKEQKVLSKSNEILKNLKKENPEIKTLDEMWAEVKQAAQASDAKYEDVSSRAGFTGMVGNFAGGMAGSFSARDPINIATLGIGGVGRTFLTKVLSETALGGSIEAVNQFIGVKQNRELLDLENSFGRSLANVAYAGAGAGLIRGTGEGVGAGVLKFKESDKDFLKIFKKEIENPTDTQKIAIEAMERDIEFIQDSNPIGKTLDDEVLHVEKIKEVEDYLNSSPATRKRLDEIEPISQKDFDVELNKLTSDIEVYVKKAQDIKKALKAEKAFDIQKPSTLKPVLGYTPKRLSDYVRERGGVYDASGELAARDIVNNASTKKAGKFSLIQSEKTDVQTENGVVQTNNNVEKVKQDAFENGYTFGKQGYDEITDDEFMDALANDLFDSPIYKDTDQLKINESIPEQSLADEYYQMGIDKDMDEMQIADILRDSDTIKSFDEIDEYYRNEINQAYHDDLARHIGETYDFIDDNADEIIDVEFEELKALQGDIYTGIEFDQDGNIASTSQKISDIIAEIEEDDALVQATKGCAL